MLVEKIQTPVKYDPVEIAEIVSRLVQAYYPLRIYLFGSYAWGTPNKDSDYDICVIVEKSDDKPRRRSLKGYYAIMDMKDRKPVDIIVYTVKDFEIAAKHPSTIASQIFREGVVIYD
ncbi:MAG: nucleotidyltransferase domain-containing protein [Planctomycetaceae bacterium]|jgi:predicted nucleotidyltransferase|nr:nucleotidyltransferase domain-containing protein [Planctomycetaceae bacterium]